MSGVILDGVSDTNQATVRMTQSNPVEWSTPAIRRPR
jgi:hypothetical protein